MEQPPAFFACISAMPVISLITFTLTLILINNEVVNIVIHGF